VTTIRDLEVTVSVKNNQLKERRLAAGLTLKELGARSGVPIATVMELEALRRQPLVLTSEAKRTCAVTGCSKVRTRPAPRGACSDHIHLDDESMKMEREAYKIRASKYWSVPAIMLAAFFETEPETLFPDSVLLLRKGRSVSKIDGADFVKLAKAIMQGDARNEFAEIEVGQLFLKERVGDALGSLSDKERSIIEQRFGLTGDDENGLDELAAGLGVSRERIRQIECKAIRKLRQPSRSGLGRLRPFVDGDEVPPRVLESIRSSKPSASMDPEELKARIEDATERALGKTP
jgi:RNA polymerase sigma factor (sigma-70 family)